MVGLWRGGGRRTVGSSPDGVVGGPGGRGEARSGGGVYGGRRLARRRAGISNLAAGTLSVSSPSGCCSAASWRGSNPPLAGSRPSSTAALSSTPHRRHGSLLAPGPFAPDHRVSGRSGRIY